MTDPKHTNTDSEIKSIIGEIPSYIFDYLELSDDTKEEWEHGVNASDFGGHNQFVQKFAKRILALKRQWQLEILEGIPDNTIVHGHQQPLTVAFLKRTLTKQQEGK